ncbi:Interferon-induced GTP-binding protein Mx2 [Hypsizygus marmoreus]|uniref:Interferon-induced GTP-binding protein Mx2 n=1 Tax=Hypsizygus marmoreus TaxID=39966 RepID=A0A369JF86_HYPMA|nr:Interferon-induced GTP-binding protein Mx2 [Hypsizygus marmoreus]
MQSNPHELSGSQYATRRKELLSLLKQLRATGSQGELDLPRITVIGNQSAGKSSVVEAISGITVPRDAGTCTRCPMECRLSSSPGQWTCQISVRREFDKSGNVLERVSEMPFGPVITDKKEVELALRRAQVAVLNPHLAPADILIQTAEKLTMQPFVSNQSLQFSRDTICIDLEGPDLTDLSFIDLPGLIQNAEPKVVKLVEDMVVSHIKGNCLILVAVPMTDDIENQKALRLARQEDPDGRRTIGVVTKPDMLTTGSTKALNLWLDVIEGRRHALSHGYYCTRQPDDAQRAADITPAQARASEAEFFSRTSPWSTSVYKERFGTNQLISTLSRLLVGIINDTLPRIIAEAASKLELCTRELATLPKEMDAPPATYMLSLLTQFCHDVQRHVLGGMEENQLIHQNRDAYASFKRTIRQTAPNFIPIKMNRSTQASEACSNNIASVQIDEHTKAKPCYLDDMRAHIKQSIARELPNNVPFRAKEVLIAEFQASWDSAVDVCFSAVQKSMEVMLEQCIRSHFYRYDHLEGHIRVFVAEIVKQHHDSCSQILGPILKVEATPFTQNSHYLSESCSKWLGKYKDTRQSDQPAKKKRKVTEDTAKVTEDTAKVTPVAGVTASPFGNINSSSPFHFAGMSPALARGPQTVATEDAKLRSALASLAELGYTGLTEEDLGRLNPPDEYETELQVMAEIRGYFQIAYKRIIDNVPSLIDFMFVKPVGTEMQTSLISKLALGTPDANDRCAMYLSENPMVVVKRKELSSRKQRLEEVKQALHNFGIA